MRNKNFFWNMIGSTFNAFNSLFFMVVVIRINGSADAGVFTYSYSVACLLYYIGIYFGRTYQVTDTKKDFSDKDYIFNRYISIFIMVIISIIFVVIMKFDNYKSLILILLTIYRAVDALAEVYYGILHKNEKLYLVGISMTLKSLCGLILFILGDIIFKNIILACIFTILFNLIITILNDKRRSKKYLEEGNSNFKSITSIYLKSFFVFAFSFLSMYIVSVPKYSMVNLPNEEQAIFGIIMMPATFVSLCGYYIINPYLNKLTEFYKNKDKINFELIVKKILLFVLGIGVFAELCVFSVAIPILNFVFKINLNDFKLQLGIIILGAVFYTAGLVYSNVLTIFRKTFVQFIIYGITALVGLAVSVVLISNYYLFGGTMSYFIIMSLQLLLYTIVTKSIMKEVFKNDR
ncbi:MAG: hypothetical protein PHN42_03905 [Bacilli bacterium]|nr:hypothetical protein [Bacilli bacterium]